MKKRLLPILLALIFVLPFIKGNYFPVNEAQNGSSFKNELVSLYQKYDTKTADNSEFSSKRLMLSGYNSDKTYGAVDCAIDKEHSFAVLQFGSEAAAKKAYEQIKADGIAVDTDSRAQLDSSTYGTVYPAGSNAIGTPSYISKFNMNKEDVIVAVIDTGIMYDHEFMENRFVSRGFDFSDDGRSNAYYDTSMAGNAYGHGTFVCGIIADNTPENVKILPYKVVPFGATEASNSALVAAIYDAVDKGASVINVSMSTTSGASAFRYAIKNALEKNVIVCASAGNDSKEIKYRYPAAIDGVVTASAVESDMETFASFSNYGNAVDFCAPGRKVFSTVPYKSGGEKYGTNSGTSFSAPFISAVCADIKSINNSYSKENVYSIICDFSKDLGDSGYDVYYGHGLPDLSDMVYTDNENYVCSIPEGTLEVTNSVDYTQQTQPWRLFADRILSVKIDDGVESIGSYAFYNMEIADFDMPQTFKSVGSYAFYSCKSITSMEFGYDVSNIGEGAFGDLSEDFYITGYSNTAAEVYSQRENINFISLGCKHNYYAEVIDPTDEEAGYTVYTCTACGDTYTGEYIEPPEYYEGECGMGVNWRYYTSDKALIIDGSGYMYSYSDQTEVPWNAFMKKIKEVAIGEEVTYISDYVLVNAVNAESITILSKTAELTDKTIFISEENIELPKICVYDDSNAKDYLAQNNIEYVSLGCKHSRRIDYYEELPSCCFDTYGVYTCSDCKKSFKMPISIENKGHYFSGVVKTLDKNEICDAEIYVDGALSAISNEKGKYVVYPILCGEHSIEIKKRGEVLEAFSVNIDRCNQNGAVDCCYGDFDCNGYINAKDYAFALKQGYSDSNILDFGAVKQNSVALQSYEIQELPYVLKISNEPNDINENKRDFIAIIENNSEFEIKESGFIYGKNMNEDMLYLEYVGTANLYGFYVKSAVTVNNYTYKKAFTYGSSDNTGTVSARFYIIYTNGVKDFITYSEVSSYVYS